MPLHLKDKVEFKAHIFRFTEFILVIEQDTPYSRLWLSPFYSPECRKLQYQKYKQKKNILNANYKIFITESLTHKYKFYSWNFII